MADIPIPRELVERALILIGAWRIDTHSTKPEVWPGSPINLESQAVLEGIAAALRSALTQQAEGVVPVAEAMGALIAAWNRLAKIHGWTRAWEPEPGDDGWIPAHEQMQRAINALISAQPSGEVLTEADIRSAVLSVGPEASGRVSMTYDSGPYEVTKVTHIGERICRAIERVTLAKIGAKP